VRKRERGIKWMREVDVCASYRVWLHWISASNENSVYNSAGSITKITS